VGRCRAPHGLAQLIGSEGTLEHGDNRWQRVTELVRRIRVETPPAGVRSSRGKARWSERTAQWMFVAPALVYLAVFFAYPIIKNGLISFQDYTTSSLYSGKAPFNGLQNYRHIFHSGTFGKIAFNTAIFTVGSMVGQFVIGLGLAIFFSRRFPLNGVIRSLILLPWLLPLVVSSTVWRWMLDQDNGVINNILVNSGLMSTRVPWLTSTSVALISVILVNIWIGIPFNMVILYSGLQDIPTDLYEAAKIDGANAVRTFRNITWPLLRPVVGVVVVLGFIYTAKVIDIILVVTGGGPVDASETLAVGSYNLAFKTFLFGEGAAMGNVLILVSLVFAAVYLRINRGTFSEAER
jgi:multiple sugar transport system permease protein